jgi:hypothetical protein
MMNHKLREYVTQSSFNLSLSKTHITALAAIYHNDVAMAYGMALYVSALGGLERRGLVEFHGNDKAPDGYEWQPQSSGYTNRDAAYQNGLNFKQRYTLTTAGILAAKLLIEAGLMPGTLKRDGVRVSKLSA